MNIDGVFSGGGVKAFAFIGALQEIEEKGFEFVRVAGTSAGAIVAGLLAAGYRANEIKQLFTQLDLTQFMDRSKRTRFIPFFNWLSLYFTMGLYKGDALEDWIYQTLAEKEVYTFQDVPEDSLKVVATDLTLGRLVVFPDDLQELYGKDPNNFLISKAIRMSAGLPYFFRPKMINEMNYGQSVIVDGGLLSNLPMWVFDDKRHTNRIRPLLGVKLSGSLGRLPSKEVNDAFDMFHAIFSTMQMAHDTRYISKKHINDVLFLPIKDVDVSNFELTKEKKEELINLGKERTEKFLYHWP